MALLAFLIAGSIVAVLIAHTLWSARALTRFGGPWSTKYNRLWLLWAHRSGRMHTIFTDLHAQYGSTVRIAPSMLLTKDLDLVHRMNSGRAGFKRSGWYITLRLYPGRDNVASTSDDRIHAELKKSMLPGASGRDHRSLEKDVDSFVLDLINLLDSKYVGQVLNLATICSYFTLDVIGRTAFSKTFGFLSTDEDVYKYNQRLHEFIPIMVATSVFPEIPRLLELPLLRWLRPKASDKDGLGKIMNITERVVAERFRQDKRVVEQDMVQSFVDHGINQRQLESESLALVVAGSESTASALRTIIHCVSQSPQILQKLRAEADQAVQEGRVSRPLATDEQLRQLPFLQACIKEGLRVKPPIHGLAAKSVPSQGVEIDGRYVPAGTSIAFNVCGVMRDTSIFGDDALDFRPGRWLSGSEEKLQEMHIAQAMIFGHGVYGCLGRSLAMMELSKATFELLTRFDFVSVRPEAPFNEFYCGFVIHTDMLTYVNRR